MQRPQPYIEENLQLDYGHLESKNCFCGDRKNIGDILCPKCMERVPLAQLSWLFSLRPGEGVAAAAAIAQREASARIRPAIKRFLK
jgi:hypothetical protein